MANLLAIFKATLGDIWNNLWTAVVCSMAWVISVLLILPGPAATFGLFNYANRLAHGEVAELEDFWQGVRRHWKPACLWGVLNLAVLLLLAFNYRVTGAAGEAAAWQFAQGLYLTLTGFWLLLQLFALPFFLEQEVPSLRMALRNSAVLIGKYPIFSLVYFLLLCAVLLLGTLLFLVSVPVGGSLIAISANRAVLNRLEAHSLSGV